MESKSDFLQDRFDSEANLTDDAHIGDCSRENPCRQCLRDASEYGTYCFDNFIDCSDHSSSHLNGGRDDEDISLHQHYDTSDALNPGSLYDHNDGDIPYSKFGAPIESNQPRAYIGYESSDGLRVSDQPHQIQTAPDESTINPAHFDAIAARLEKQRR